MLVAALGAMGIWVTLAKAIAAVRYMGMTFRISQMKENSSQSHRKI